MSTDLTTLLNVPQTAPPEPFSFGLLIDKSDRDKFALEYGGDIDRALAARRTGGSQGFQWVGDVPAAATKATRVLDTARSLVRAWEDEIQDNWDRYDMVPPNRELPFEGGANFRTPTTRWIVDAILARILAGVATIRPIFRVEPRPGESLQQAGKLEEFLDYVLEHEVDFVEFLDVALLQAAVEGAGVAYVTWSAVNEHRLVEEIENRQDTVLDENNLPVSDEFGGFVQKQTSVSRIVERDEAVSAQPRIDLIPLTDFLVGDPRRRTLKDQPWMGHRTRLYRAELLQLRGSEGYFDEELDALIAGAGNVTTGPSLDKVDQGIEARTGIATGSTASPTMRMLDTFDIWTIIAWYDWDLDGKPERVVAEIAMPQKRLIRLIKYPYLHNRPFYVPLVLMPRSNFFYPYSLAGSLRMSQDELDAMTNHRIDATSVAISSLFMYMYDEQAGFDPSRTRISLGESIKVTGDINHIQSLAKAFRGVTVPGVDIINYILDMVRQLSGIHEMQTGGLESKRATAFEVGAVIQEGNVKFRRMIERVSVALSEIAYQIIALYQQHGNRAEAKMFKVLNDPENPFRTMDMSELAGRWNYRVHGMAIASQRDIDARKAKDLMDLVAQHPILQEFIAPDPLRRYHLARTFLQKIGWPVEEVIGKEEDVIQAMRVKAEAAQRAQPAGGATPEVEQFVQEQMAKARGGGQPSSGEAGAAAVAEGTGL